MNPLLPQIEFLRLSEKRILLVIVTPDGNVQNRRPLTESDYTPTQLNEAGNYINHHYSGLSLNMKSVSACKTN